MLDLQDEYRQDSTKKLKMKFVKTHETMERLCFVLSLTSLSRRYGDDENILVPWFYFLADHILVSLIIMVSVALFFKAG